ncbi:uncharacterized protein LOC114020591 [Chelonia mydas]|uniref:uncharacterized protein LOC114020591 n=1 Tax=Chelonia mydas TaxID=8469 RepID=UPI001CA82EF0|nr:uncharacterized protein LOC114020591 [Chelonia mydas]
MVSATKDKRCPEPRRGARGRADAAHTGCAEPGRSRRGPGPSATSPSSRTGTRRTWARALQARGTQAAPYVPAAAARGPGAPAPCNVPVASPALAGPCACPASGASVPPAAGTWQAAATGASGQGHDKLQAVLGGDPTATLHATVDVSEEPKPQAPAMNWKEEERERDDTRSQDLPETPALSSQSCQLSMDLPVEGEGTSAAATAALRGFPLYMCGTPEPDCFQTLKTVWITRYQGLLALLLEKINDQQ